MCLCPPQVLELFDKVLWPGEDSLLEEVTSSNRMPAGPAGKFPHQPPMLLTLVQLSLLVLASVHPSDPAAAANANRLRKLIQWLLQLPSMAVRGKRAAALAEDGGSAQDWAVLVVVHVHISLRQCQSVMFDGSLSASNLAHAAGMANLLLDILSLLASANDELLKVTFGASLDKQLRALLRQQQPPAPASAWDSKVDPKLSVQWLRESPWLSAAIGKQPEVSAVFSRIGEEEMKLEEDFQEFVHSHWSSEALQSWDKPAEAEAEAERRGREALKALAKAESKREKGERQKADVNCIDEVSRRPRQGNDC